MNGVYKTLDENLIDTKVVARYAFKKGMSLTPDIVYRSYKRLFWWH